MPIRLWGAPMTGPEFDRLGLKSGARGSELDDIPMFWLRLWRRS